MTNILSAEQNAQAKRSPANKTHVSYWKKRIFQPVYIRDSQKISSPNFCIEIQHAGERRRWSLGPGTREVAAARARQIYLHLITHGWASTIQRFKPQSAPKADCSIGDFLEAVKCTADLSNQTLRSYIAALQKITADINGLASDNAKYAAGAKSRKAWLEKLYSVKLSVLSAENVQTWKRDFLARAGQDPLSQRSAKVSVNSFLRCAKSLFSPRILEHVKLELPSPLPFAGAQFEARPSSKYRSTFDIASLVRSATEALAPTDPEAYKAFLLASMVGLRRKEIDLLEWSAFRWDSGTIRIETTQHFSAKSEDSLGDVAVDSQVLDAFRGYRASASGPFVIESPEQPRTVNYNFYRCEETFDRLIDWLRSQGVRSLKPLHTLRKEFGSEVCRHFGIYAASAALRHSDIKITCQYYVQDRTRATVGLGHLLETGKVVEFKREVA